MSCVCYVFVRVCLCADSDKIPSELLSPEMQKSTPVMEDFSISVSGILNYQKI